VTVVLAIARVYSDLYRSGSASEVVEYCAYVCDDGSVPFDMSLMTVLQSLHSAWLFVWLWAFCMLSLAFTNRLKLRLKKVH